MAAKKKPIPKKKPAPKKAAVTKSVKKKVAPAARVVAATPAPSLHSLGASVEDYVSKVIPWQRTVIERLRRVLRTAAPSASESIKWGQPVYEHKGPFAYIKAYADGVNFGFWRGAELNDGKRMLQGVGEKMRHVKILETHVLDEDTLAAFVKQAVALNDKKGDPTKGP
jgi:hypothetical protein